MQADRIVEALRRHAFGPGEDVDTSRVESDHLTVVTTGYPSVDPPLVSAPRVRQADRDTTIEFFSHNYHLLELGAAVDIVRWNVTAVTGHPATWTRDTVVERQVLPLPKG